ncbi:SusC/RagA family TonB-linked outer membrane protein [Sphingobacterium paucimobilis]|nr:SusC/RagA family TonB-linked outer membrane protein [Sphingobacterium paucimobilis]
MKLSTILLLIGTFQLHAVTLAQRVSLRADRISLERTFGEIKKQTGYDFVYDESLIKSVGPLNLNIQNKSLEETLDHLLSSHQLSYSITDKIVTVRGKESRKATLTDGRQQGIVIGTVRDEKGNPLVGVTIVIEGQNKGTQTDNKGGFRIEAAIGDRLNCRLLGYYHEIKSIEKYGPGIIVVLKNRIESLDAVAVVNTGYQKISKERSAGSYAKPDMKVLMERSGTIDIIQRLDGLIPGLVINNSSSPTNGPVGSSSSGNSIMIRGLNTLNSSREPLIVLNGVPSSDISAINPNDVEDITVLKDATAASIWGSKAANGVIVITTKKGKNKEAIQVNYNGFINFQGKPQIEKLNTLDSRAFIQAAKDVFDPVLNNYASISRPQSGGLAPIMPHETILYNLENLSQEQVDAKLEALANQNGIAQAKDLFYRNAVLMNHNISLSGGTERYNYYGSGAYIDNKSSKIGDKNKNYSINLNQSYTFNKWLQLHLITDISNKDIVLSNAIQPTAAFLPYVLYKNADGSSADLSWLYRDEKNRKNYEQLSGTSLGYAPLDEINTGNTSNNIWTAKINSGVTVNLLKGLRYEGVFSLSKMQSKTINDLTQDNYDVRSELVSFTPLDGSAPYISNKGGRHTNSFGSQKNWTVRNQFVYDNTWLEGKHSLILLAGQEAQEQLYNTNRSVVRGYNNQLMTVDYLDYKLLSTGVNNVVMPTSSDGTSRLTPDFYTEGESLVRITSYYANSGYTFDNRYTINLASRIDQSNLFGKDKSAQNKPLWSVGLGWQIGKERFMEQFNWLNQLGLRTSFGLTGNSPNPGEAASQDILATLYAGNAVVYPEGVGLELAMPANKKLTWETTKTFNFGIDFSLLNNRISGSVDVYDKHTQNLIAPMFVNPLTGFSTITGNAGNLTNKGLDINLTTVNISHKDFSWSTLLNLGYNSNKLTKINRERPITRGDQLISNPYVEGYPAFAVFSYHYAGLDQVGDPQIYLQDGSITKQRSVTTVDDMRYMGTFQPVWSGGLTNRFTYRNLSLAANIVYNLGHVMRRDVNTLFGGRGLVANQGYFAMFTGNVNAEFSDRWKKPGDELITDIPAYTTSSTSLARGNMSYYTNADRNVLNASYIKLRDITLGYKLPTPITDKLRTQAVTLRLQVSNIMLWKANSVGIDPEFLDAYGGWDGSATILGIYQGGYRKTPINQGTVTLGASISF